jgi:hypothetical protein
MSQYPVSDPQVGQREEEGWFTITDTEKGEN